jgi:hypothetical protein
MNNAVAAATPLILMEGACAAVVTAFTITASVDVSIVVGGVAIVVAALSTSRTTPLSGDCPHVGTGTNQVNNK